MPEIALDPISFRMLDSLVEQAEGVGAASIIFQGQDIPIATAKGLVQQVVEQNPDIVTGGPFEEVIPDPITHEQIRDYKRRAKCSFKQARAALKKDRGEYTLHRNGLYQVAKYDTDKEIIHLSIKRLDKAAVHSWRDLQWIKNQLVGPEHDAIEIYPAEDKLVDMANQYHLWVFADPEYRIPIGFNEGRHADNMAADDAGKARQKRNPDYD